MPRIRRAKLPQAVLDHFLRRAQERRISFNQMIALSRWLDTDPIVPQGKWFKRFDGFILCGEDELVKTFLLPGQSAVGEEIR
jgi:hypothetical protein